MIEMTVVGIRVEQSQSEPVLLLREASGVRYLPIWIGQGEASAIAVKLQGIAPSRPLTHDLFVDVVRSMGRAISEVRITELREGTFFADLVFDNEVVVSARPSDSVALAVRLGVPIFADEQVLAEAGLDLPDDEAAALDSEVADAVAEDADADAAGGGDDEVERFKEFLDTISPDDFKGSQ